MPSLEDIPTYFADFFNINLGSAQIFLSVTLIMAVLLPTLYLTRGGESNLPTMLVFYLMEVVLVGIGWLDFWILITTLFILAAVVALLGSKVVMGG